MVDWGVAFGQDCVADAVKEHNREIESMCKDMNERLESFIITETANISRDQVVIVARRFATKQHNQRVLVGTLQLRQKEFANRDKQLSAVTEYTQLPGNECLQIIYEDRGRAFYKDMKSVLAKLICNRYIDNIRCVCVLLF